MKAKTKKVSAKKAKTNTKKKRDTREAYERVNITLPKETLAWVDLHTGHGNRSGFINDAITHYLSTEAKKKLRQRLKEGYIARAKEALEDAREWAQLEDEVWSKIYENE